MTIKIVLRADYRDCVKHISMPRGVSPLGRIILGVGPCRSGTTPWLRLFAQAGIEGHFQPIKNIMRHEMMGLTAPKWEIPPGTIAMKETLGPYHVAEVKYDPLKVLREVGYQDNHIDLVVLFRDPIATWASWKWWWGERVNIDTFLWAWVWTWYYANVAEMQGFRVHYFVYEVLRDFEPYTVAQKLFERLQLQWILQPGAVSGWRKPRIIWPTEPAQFMARAAHAATFKSTSWKYNFDPRKIEKVTPEEVLRIKACHADASYLRAYEKCVDELGLEEEVG